jgi:F-type H+-transporting ATPase subunit delta
MTVVADNYARVLLDMNIATEDVETMRALLEDEAVFEALENPFVDRKSKHSVIDQLFPKATRSFVKVMSDNGDIALAGELFQAFDQLVLEGKNMVRATFTYVTKPDDAQVEKLKRLICTRYGKDGVELTLKEDKSLVGGFILAVGDSVLDKSLRTSILKMQRHFAVR